MVLFWYQNGSIAYLIGSEKNILFNSDSKYCYYLSKGEDVMNASVNQ